MDVTTLDHERKRDYQAEIAKALTALSECERAIIRAYTLATQPALVTLHSHLIHFLSYIRQELTKLQETPCTQQDLPHLRDNA